MGQSWAQGLLIGLTIQLVLVIVFFVMLGSIVGRLGAAERRLKEIERHLAALRWPQLAWGQPPPDLVVDEGWDDRRRPWRRLADGRVQWRRNDRWVETEGR